MYSPYRIRPPSHAEAWNGEAINNQYTQLGTCILGPILSAAHTRSPISIVSAKCRLQDSCNSARCAQHAHAHTTRVSQLQDASMLLWAFKWGFGSDFVYAFAKANACCVELTIAQIARQTTTRRRARVCVYALAIQRWQHNPRMKISHYAAYYSIILQGEDRVRWLPGGGRKRHAHAV